MSNAVKSATAAAPAFAAQKKPGPISPSSPKKDLELSSRSSAHVLPEPPVVAKPLDDGGGKVSSEKPQKRRSIKGVVDRSKSLFSGLRKKKSRNVVCIDSDQAVLESLSKILEELGFFAVCFTSSVEAKQYLLEQLQGGGGVALVIASMMMTGINGMQLMQEIKAMREETGDVPFLLTSSFSKGNAKVQEFQIKTTDGTMADVVLKPLVSGVIVRKVRELTGDEETKRKDSKELTASSMASSSADLNTSAGAINNSNVSGGGRDASGGLKSKDGSLRNTKVTSPGTDRKTGQQQPRSPPTDRTPGERESARKGRSGNHSGAIDGSGEPSLTSSTRSAGERSPASVPMNAVNANSKDGGSGGYSLSGSGSPQLPGANATSAESPTRSRSKTISNVTRSRPRKNSDPGIEPPQILPRSVSQEGTFLDSLFSASSMQGLAGSHAGPDWGELEDEPPEVPALKASSRRKTIHGISSLKKRNNL